MILPPKRPSSPKPKPLSRLLAEPVYQRLPHALAQQGEVPPLGVMVRGLLEWLLDPPTVETLLHHHAPDHYTRELTITAVVGLFIQVTTGARRSVHAAYKADPISATPTTTTTYQALYGKLGRFPPAVSEAVVRSTAERCTQRLSLHPAPNPEPVPGYRLRILDGNVVLTGTDHRLTPLRRWLNACVPGKSLVVYEPGLGLVTDVVSEEDAYTQELRPADAGRTPVAGPGSDRRGPQLLYDPVCVWCAGSEGSNRSPFRIVSCAFPRILAS